MNRIRSILVLTLLAMAAFTAQASATPTTITSNQYARVYQGTTDTGQWWDVVGSNPPFGTSSIVVDRVGTDLLLTLNTTFTGSYFTNGDCFGSVCAMVADIALSTNGGASYDMGISLGKHGTSAGLYNVASNGWLTSRDVWAPNGNGFYYGGGWDTCATASACTTNHIADTVIKTGQSLVSNSSVSISLTSSAIQIVVHGFTYTGPLAIFWGTADCSNDPIYGTVAAVPEPHAAAAMLLALVLITGTVALRRRMF